jgi:sporulation protein YlmC with PRC-barrel domain
MAMTQALSASTLTGDTVRNAAGDDLGTLHEIVIDLHSGRVAYAVLAAGGFLGMGEKFFAIPWDLLTVDTDNEEVILNVEKEILQNAPGFDKDNWPLTTDRAWISEVFSYYGSKPYWEVTD